MENKILLLQDTIDTAETNLEKAQFTVEAVESSFNNLLELLNVTLKMQGMGANVQLGLDIVEDYLVEVRGNISKAKKIAEELKQGLKQA